MHNVIPAFSPQYEYSGIATLKVSHHFMNNFVKLHRIDTRYTYCELSAATWLGLDGLNKVLIKKTCTFQSTPSYPSHRKDQLKTERSHHISKRCLFL